LDDAKVAKNFSAQLEKTVGDAVVLLSTSNNGKVQLMLQISKSLIESKSLHAGKIIKEISQHIKGGGGGQDFYASAGGTDASGIAAAHQALEGML